MISNLEKQKVDTSSVTQNLQKFGFAKGTEKILSDLEVKEFEQIIDRLHRDASIEKDFSANGPVINKLIGRDDHLDDLIEKILSSQQVKDVLDKMLGDTYKIWEIGTRISLVDDKGLKLHQDGIGQINLAFFINDQEVPSGVTGLLAGSHLLPRWAKSISWSSINIAKHLLTPLTGKSGEHAFFINKTWHGRLPSFSKSIHKILLIGFFPTGATYRPIPMFNPKKKVIQPVLQRLLSVTEDVKALDDGLLEVTAGNKNTTGSLPYTMEIEEKNSITFPLFFLYGKVLMMEIFFRPIRFLYRLVNIFRK